MVYVRYIHNCDFKEELLFCQPLDSQTRGIDIFNKVDNFFVNEGLDWRSFISTLRGGTRRLQNLESGSWSKKG